MQADACAACGTSLPKRARFCSICGATRAVNGSSRAAHPGPGTNGHAPDTNTSAPEALTIELRRGFARAEFVATVSNGESSFIAARSGGFACRGSSGPVDDDPRALAAFDVLVEALDAQGWVPANGDGRWPSHEFRRRSDGIGDVVDDLTVHPVGPAERVPEQDGKQ